MVRTTMLLPAIAMLAVLAGCNVQSRSRTQFAGVLKSSTPTCPQTNATLSIRDDTVVFAPSEGTWLLSGSLVNGRIVIQRSRPNAQGKPFTATLDATVTNQRVEGKYTTSFCAYDVALNRF